MLVELLLPEVRYCLFEIGLHTPVWPLVLSRVVAILIEEFSSMESALATFALPGASATSPVRGPQLLVLVNAANTFRHVFTRIAEIPTTRMALASLFVIGNVLEDFVTSPVKAHLILHIHFLLFIRRHGVTRFARVLGLIRHRSSKIATEACIYLKFSLLILVFPPSVRRVWPHMPIKEVFFGFFIRVLNEFMVGALYTATIFIFRLAT